MTEVLEQEMGPSITVAGHDKQKTVIKKWPGAVISKQSPNAAVYLVDT